MNLFSFFIARRIYQSEEGGKQVSRPAVLIAMVGIALGLAVMILSVAVVVGFKKEVRAKVTGLGSHIQITNFDGVRSYETKPIAAGDSIFRTLYAYPEVKHVQRYSTKPGMIKMDDAFQGMILKGVGQEFDASFFRNHLVEGEIPQFSDTVASNQVLISKTLAAKLKLKPEDKVYTYYIEDEVRARRFTIKGIFQTNISEYDNNFLMTDIYTVNRLKGWKYDQVSGLEIQVKDFSRLAETTYRIAIDTDRRLDRYGEPFYVRNIEELNPQIFGWLDMLDLNVWVILILMIGVAGFTVISGLLIIILERTNMIGVLKALGANNQTIRKVFLWLSVFLIGKGMLWGNLLGAGFYFVQTLFGVFKLDPETYFVDTVPMSLNIWIYLSLNIGTLVVSLFMLIGPSYLITRIEPANSMRYE
ncbi:MAG: ABC transporter permease [Mediterranea sp.]|jgi:lipoprotein-releasing system permease protein|nr:ABC transporter permease [Mediterranea sp.]